MMSPEWQAADLQRNADIVACFPAIAPIFAVPFDCPSEWNCRTLDVACALRLKIAFATME